MLIVFAETRVVDPYATAWMTFTVLGEILKPSEALGLAGCFQTLRSLF